MENYDDHILKFTNLLLSKQEGQDPVNIIPEMLLKNNKKMLDFKINVAVYVSVVSIFFAMLIISIFSLFLCYGTTFGCFFMYFGSIIVTYYLSKYFFRKFIF